MAKFNVSRLLAEFNKMSKEDKKKKAHSNVVIHDEIENVMEDTKISLYNQPREYAVKYALWQGLLNQYGIFGTHRSSKRLFGKEKDINYYDENYKHGDLISIDFGMSNLDKEFSYTHTAIVLKSYTDYVVVIPTTSCKEGRLETKPQDEQDDTLIITYNDFSNIESDSYIMIYQVRSVSKNRIQKKIGSIGGTTLLENIDNKILEIFANSSYIKLQECYIEIDKMKSENAILQAETDKLQAETDKLKEELEYLKNKLTNDECNGTI